MADEVILRVTNMSTSLQFGKFKIDAEPVGDMFYSIEIEPEHVQMREEGIKVFTRDGIRHVMKGLLATLMLDMDREQF